MSLVKLYRGLWPRNVSKLAKYAVRLVANEWRVTVLYEVGEGLRYLAVEDAGAELAQRVNGVKASLRQELGGTFYVNEYRHVLVPVADTGRSGFDSHYYYAGKMDMDFMFDFEGQALTTRPIRRDETPLDPGESWVGPRPGIPYVLAAGGDDVYYESPALTEDDPPKIRHMMIRRVQLSKVLGDRLAAANAVRPVAAIRGHQGGRFYVNEHGAMFTPVGAGEGNGIHYIYCGQIERRAWFPEPPCEPAL
jgi:hypothetical protein